MEKKKQSKIEKVAMRIIIGNGKFKRIDAVKINDDGAIYWRYSTNGREILHNSQCPPMLMKGLLERKFKEKGLPYKINLPDSYRFS